MRQNRHLIELLIHEVKKNPILYDKTLPDYKNNVRKKLVWEEIADKIGGESGATMSWKWKNLRDNYSKHLKNFTGASNEAAQKLIHWRWASFMTFLNPHLQKPKTAAVETVDIEYGIQVKEVEEINTQNDDDCDDDPLIKHCVNDYKISEHEQDSNSCNFYSESVSSDRSHRRKRTYVETYVDADELYKQQSSTETLDKIDYLFLNYAATFKKLSPRRQVLMKLKMAEIFAKAELQEIDQNSD